MSKGKPRVGGLLLGKAVGYQPTGVEMSKGRPRVGGLVFGKSVGYQPTGQDTMLEPPFGNIFIRTAKP